MMTLCDKLKTQLGEVVVCTSHDRYVRLRTPFLYPDGDVIDLFYDEQSRTLTDLAETTRWLRMQTVSLRRSPKQKQLIEDICLNHGVEFFKGMLLMRLKDDVSLADSVVRLAQAAIRVADLWFTMRTKIIESITDEVADFLAEQKIAFERREKLIGRSGRGWTVDFHTRTSARSNLVFVLSTGSRAAARGVTEHVVAAWYDLSHLTVGMQALRFVSLFDDTTDVWSVEDFKLLDPLSEIARWSRPDEFALLISEAA
jgi:hypothetical protein